jgi:hypothetical protein
MVPEKHLSEVLRALAHSIQIAHRASPSKWGIRLNRAVYYDAVYHFHYGRRPHKADKLVKVTSAHTNTGISVLFVTWGKLTTMWSENVVISGRVAMAGLSVRLLVRGALSRGRLYHHGRVVVGEAMVDAYLLECKVALHPRVVVSPRITDDNRLFTDTDGQRCLDYSALGDLEAMVKPKRAPIRLAPYMREIADAIGDPKVERVTCLKSARIGWTTVMSAAVAHFTVRDPCPMEGRPRIGVGRP